jgi:hypothetical protein
VDGMAGTFVTVGNAVQPFGRLLRALDEAEDHLPSAVFIQSGRTQIAPRCDWMAVPFLEMTEFERRLADARLIVAHAGTGVVIQGAQARKVPTLPISLTPFRRRWPCRIVLRSPRRADLASLARSRRPCGPKRRANHAS